MNNNELFGCIMKSIPNMSVGTDIKLNTWAREYKKNVEHGEIASDHSSDLMMKLIEEIIPEDFL